MGVIIEKIEFENFRQYGTGSLSFNEEGKNLSVIIAKNGTGKTTLLNSITWCLYEKEQQIVDKKTSLAVVSTARLESESDGAIIPVSVTLTIKDDNTKIEFTRSQRFKKNFDKKGSAFAVPSTSILRVVSYINGVSGQPLIEDGADAEIKVKKYFDPEIFDFYFFDGEQLREFFSAERTTHIKGSIYNIAQVTLLQTAYDHIENLRTDTVRKISKNNPDSTELVNKHTMLVNYINTKTKEIENSKKEKENAEEKLNQIDDMLRGYLPIKKLQDERKELENSLKNYDEEKKRIREEKLAFIRKYLVLLKLYPRIKRSLQIIQVKENEGDLSPIFDRNQIRALLDDIDKPCPLCDNPHIGERGKIRLEHLLNEISVSSRTSSYLKEIKGALENYIEEADKYQEQKNSLIEKELDLLDRIASTEDRLKVINSMLANFSTDEGQVDVSALEWQRAKQKKIISAADMAIGSNGADIKRYEREVKDIQREINEAQEKLGLKTSLMQQGKVLEKLSHNYAEIKNHITTAMREDIQKTTWEKFDRMIWKKNTFGRILIGDDYEISVYNKEGAVMTGSLSATEQMALAYSFTLAIHEASGKNCPIVIDSPLGRVSDENRENMAEALLEISKEKQIIMLFTPDEFSPAVRALYEGKASIRTLKLSADEKFIEGIK